jgi:hypothetical protein
MLPTCSLTHSLCTTSRRLGYGFFSGILGEMSGFASRREVESFCTNEMEFKAFLFVYRTRLAYGGIISSGLHRVDSVVLYCLLAQVFMEQTASTDVSLPTRWNSRWIAPMSLHVFHVTGFLTTTSLSISRTLRIACVRPT